jgi:hypothetical protein
MMGVPHVSYLGQFNLNYHYHWSVYKLALGAKPATVNYQQTPNVQANLYHSRRFTNPLDILVLSLILPTNFAPVTNILRGLYQVREAFGVREG